MRTSKPGKAVYLEIGVWYNEEHDRIHVTAKDVKGFHTTVNANPSSKRGHPNLYRKLAVCLREAGVPAPAFDEPIR